MEQRSQSKSRYQCSLPMHTCIPRAIEIRRLHPLDLCLQCQQPHRCSFQRLISSWVLTSSPIDLSGDLLFLLTDVGISTPRTHHAPTFPQDTNNVLLDDGPFYDFQFVLVLLSFLSPLRSLFQFPLFHVITNLLWLPPFRRLARPTLLKTVSVYGAPFVKTPYPFHCWAWPYP